MRRNGGGGVIEFGYGYYAWEIKTEGSSPSSHLLGQWMPISGSSFLWFLNLDGWTRFFFSFVFFFFFLGIGFSDSEAFLTENNSNEF